ncbi:FtsX-like permease family protein [Streptosporangiaceae bacterium NEAU-GS5]|nr:FtsX-like permease family protein [Streptosporangiaceae bacterium NEAU-GS5]
MTRLLLVKLARDVSAAKGRIALMVIVIGVGLVAFSTILYTRTIVDREIGRSYRATEPASATLLLRDPVDQAVLNGVRALPGVRDTALRAQFDARWRGADGRWSADPLQTFVYAPGDPLRVARFRVEQGTWPPPPGGILIERVAMRVMGVHVGDPLTIREPGGAPRTLRITGVVHDPSLAPADNEAKGYGYVTGQAFDQVKLLVDGEDPAMITRVARDVGAWLRARGLTVEEIQVPPPFQHPHQGQMNAITAVVLVFAALAFVLSSFLVATLLGGLLTRHIPHIGMLKAVGASSRRLFQPYLLMIFLIGAVATLLAFAPGVVAARLFSGRILDRMLNMDLTDVSVPAWENVAVVAAGVAIPVLLALAPITRAARTTVRQALDHHGGADRATAFGKGRGGIVLMALRNLTRRRTRLALSAGLLAVSGTLFVAAMNVYASFQGAIADAGDQHSVDVEVRTAGPVTAAAVRGVPGVAGVEAWRAESAAPAEPGQISVTATYPDQGHGGFRLVAVPPDTAMLRVPLTQGRWLRPGDVDAAVVNQSRQIGGRPVRVGDTLALSIGGRLTSWHVIGVEQEVFPQGSAYVTPEGLARATGRPYESDLLMVTTVRHDPGARAAAADAVETALSQAGVQVTSSTPRTRYDQAVDGHMYAMLAVLLAIAGALGLVGVIGLAGAMSSAVIERTREFGILHAIGAPAGAVRRLVVAEGVFTALLGCLLAVVPALALTAALRSGLSRMFVPLPFRMSVAAMVTWFAVVVVGAALAVLGPAVRASRLTVRDALARD